MPALAYDGPFATASTLDLNYPRFDQIKDDDFAPAFDYGMARQLAEIDVIANSPEAPTFQNTIVALEKSGLLLDRATSVFFNLVGTDKNDARDKLQTQYAPKFSAHRDAISLNPRLFARIKTLHDARATLAGCGGPALLESPTRLRARRRRAQRCAESRSAKSIPIGKLGTQSAERAGRSNDSAIVVDTAPSSPAFAPADRAAAEAAKGAAGRHRIALSTPPASPPWPSWKTAPCASACTRPRWRAAAAAGSTTTPASCPGCSSCAPSAPG